MVIVTRNSESGRPWTLLCMRSDTIGFYDCSDEIGAIIGIIGTPFDGRRVIGQKTRSFTVSTFFGRAERAY